MMAEYLPTSNHSRYEAWKAKMTECAEPQPKGEHIYKSPHASHWDFEYWLEPKLVHCRRFFRSLK